MTEIPPEEQIQYLLGTGRIKEAKEIFLLKENKGQNFNNKLKQFNADAGWVYLNQQLDFENVVTNFKQTEIDPREIVLLFKEYYETSTKILATENLARKPGVFIHKIIEQTLMSMGQTSPAVQKEKLREA